MPRILYNASTVYTGGGLQASISFMAQILQDPAEFTWQLVLSPPAAEQARQIGVQFPSNTIILPETPARNRAARKQLAQIEADIKPDAVYTTAGPAYVNFQRPHLLGCVLPWVSHASVEAYRTLSFPHEWLGYWLLAEYKKRWFRKANMWVTETENSRQGMHRSMQLPLEAVHVVGSSCGAPYLPFIESERPFPSGGQEIRLFCFTAFYKHKNLFTLPAIAAELQKIDPNLNFEIVLTLKDDSNWHAIRALAEKLQVANRIVNHGPVPIADGPRMYQSCDICLYPTVLETFTAAYPEAMAMGMPIVTTDLDFSRDACGDAALYYPPRDARAGAAAISQLVHDKATWDRLVKNGKARLKLYPLPIQKREMYLELIRKLLAKKCD